MKRRAKRILAALLSLCMVVTALTPAITAEAETALVNVALDATASTENSISQWCDGIAAVNDGDDATNYQSPGEWPTAVALDLGGNHNVSKVVVKIGGADGEEYRSLDVTVEYAQNSITSDLITFGSDTSTVNTDKEFTVSTPVSASHIYVTLSNPQDPTVETPTFWPAIDEIEVYEAQEVELSAYNNIASQAVITTTGTEHPSEGSSNLTDGSDSTLYKFHNAAMESEQEIVLTYDEARAMDAFRIAFENVGETDDIGFLFTYSILAKNGDGAYDTIVANATANRTDNSAQTYQIEEKTYSEVKIVMHSCTTSSGNGWPAVAEFEVYGSEVEVDDSESIAWQKPVHTSSGKNLAANITDGSVNSTWRGSYYPAYVDIDLEANYDLDTVEVYTPESGYSQYSIYTSMDGRDFEKLTEKTSTESASLETGEVYKVSELDDDGREARIVRVYLEYNSAETAAVLNEVRITGTATGSEIQERPAINVEIFGESEEYKDTLTVTAQDTYDEVYGIIERRLGAAYKDWFTLELAENPDGTGYDYYELSTVDGKIHVKGNDGVSLATGINHYLKYYCNVNISQVGDQVTMPETMPVIDGTVHKETKAEVRYSYNYCTLSYSMAFWGKEEWRNELDWLALNGVNVVLDATAQEEVWRRFLGKIGYEHEDIKDFIAGPAYYAWAYMANLSGFGGPVHDSWFEERTELARENQLIMRKLGMQPVLQGYSGMVPTDIVDNATGEYAITSSDIIGQGTWCSFQRPAMLVTTSEAFDKYASLFYECQKEVYGDTSNYYATDPFHEGGNTGGMASNDISREVLTSMLEADPDSIWIIQAWQGNPTTALLNGLDEVTDGAQHALILDLYAEKTPHYGETGNSYGDTDEFDDTPWLFCMLNNFGGRLGMHGHLDNLANNIPAAFNNTEHIAGIGITPEASVNNPVLYDFLFETIWQDDAEQTMQVINLDTWLDDYAARRYGAESESANQAWDILKETVYKSSLNNLGQGAPESVVNARPALSISAASTWGNAVISYDKLELEKAAALLLEDYDTLKSSEGYLYDVATVLQQVLSNSAQTYHGYMASAFQSGDLAAFEEYATTFMEIIDAMEQVTGTSEYYLLGRWVEQAKALAENAEKDGDDFSKELYEMNAKALITTWGSYNQAESGGLKDYSNRQWSGLINDFYKVRWQRWIDARTSELKGESYESNINWFEWEWSWVRGNAAYTTTPAATDLSILGAEILEKYTVEDGASDDSRDLETSKITYSTGSAQSGEGIELAFDGVESTYWHSEWNPSWSTSELEEYLWVEFDLEEATVVDAIRYLPRNGNGDITGYRIEGKTADGEDWVTLTTGTWTRTGATWKIAEFDATEVVALRLVATSTYADSGNNKFASASELRVRTAESEETPEVPSTVDKTALAAAITAAEALNEDDYTADSWAAFQTALTAAKTVNKNADATQDAVNEALAGLQAAQEALQMAVLTEKTVTVKVGETVRVFDQSGTFDEVGLDTLDPAIAEVTVETETINDLVAKLYNGSSYDGDSIDLSECIYTFNKNADGTYCISGITTEGTTVYMNPRTEGKVGYPHTATSENIAVEAIDGGFKFKDASDENYYLTFKNDWLVFNETQTADVTTVFQLYELQAKVADSGEVVYEYQPVTEVQDGGQYVIVAEFTDTDGNAWKYALRPSTDLSEADNGVGRNSHVARVTDEVVTSTGNEILISGVSVGDTEITVGNTKYDIHVVADERYIELKKGESVTLYGTSVKQEPDTQYVTFAQTEGENSYQITAVNPGETTVVIDDVIYHITVLETQIASGIGTSTGQQVNRLTISADRTFDLNIINSDSTNVQWKVTDKDGNEVDWATVSADGVVAAKNPNDYEKTYEGYIVAVVDGQEVKTELKLTPAPMATALRLYDVYIGELYHTNVYYGWIYEYTYDTDSETPELSYGSTELTQVVEGEVIYVSISSERKNALDFFAKPEEGYALTQMGATGTAGHYMRLDGETPEATEFITESGVAGSNQYYKINAEATSALVQKAMDEGCHGAQGFTRLENEGNLNTILNYRSEKLPTVTKDIKGILGKDGLSSSYRIYKEGMTAHVGEYVYYEVTVETYDAEDPLTYTEVKLNDVLEGAEFYEKDSDAETQIPTQGAGSELDITEVIAEDGAAMKGNKHTYHVVYQIQEEDVLKESLINEVELTYNYASEYSTGIYDGGALDDAKIIITSVLLNNIVIDFGLPVENTCTTNGVYFQEVTEPIKTKYGEVTVKNTVKEVTDTHTQYENTVTYTPTSMLLGVDEVTLALVELNGETSYYTFYVYPANSVYYEEDFADYSEGWALTANENGKNQQLQTLSAEDADHYGYDLAYVGDENENKIGPSNGTEAVSAAPGKTATFTFDGTGIDIYANCQGGDTPTGAVTVLIRNHETQAIEKLMIVNTLVAGTAEGATDPQNAITNAYSLPVVSVNDLIQGAHDVKLGHTQTKAEIENNKQYPVKIDGFRVYDTLADQGAYSVHNEANPFYTEMRNVVLNALEISDLYEADSITDKSIYAEDIAQGLMQVLDKSETGAGIIVDNSISASGYDNGNAQDLLDNGPKNEIFLYKDQSLVIGLSAGLKNTQIGLKAVNGPVSLSVSKQGAEGTATAVSTVPGTINTSTDMFYVIGDITENTTITITNNGDGILSVTDLKYFVGMETTAVFYELSESDFIPALLSLGYEMEPSVDKEMDQEVHGITRIFGGTRYETAYAAADAYKEKLGVEKFDAVIVATGTKFADALSGSYLASVKNAPILLTNGKADNVAGLFDYIKENVTPGGIVYILGGTKAVPETVEAVEAEGYTVKRLFGDTRYDTNIEILKEAGVTGNEILIATGKSSADSLSVSATKKPILLVEDEITDAQRAVLRQYDGGKIYIIGGENAVSGEIETALTGHGRIYRISGATRYETSVKVAETFFEEAEEVIVASGREKNYADGLCGGPLAALMDVPLILTKDGKTDAAAGYVQAEGITSGMVLGGTDVISDESVGEIFRPANDDAQSIAK